MTKSRAFLKQNSNKGAQQQRSTASHGWKNSETPPVRKTSWSSEMKSTLLLFLTLLTFPSGISHEDWTKQQRTFQSVLRHLPEYSKCSLKIGTLCPQLNFSRYEKVSLNTIPTISESFLGRTLSMASSLGIPSIVLPARCEKYDWLDELYY